ncbi:hypothetical protein KV102_05140 [Mumia sp. zg.B53]|uniref:hypothetical protein n=1 Tax=unclassified Mumia TaxID=2621872 RepID=UPI001C6EB178|nr:MULTISPECIES: hypothetical protein [unclassified Mumia]MBW9204398.1 hypothetical protein [Mumia sp. zg.B17]MBW9214221.1 hypothetical protein [Mumia sp. zg.B53]MDD9348357.1 hypothetical protein [Mumia sp.]
MRVVLDDVKVHGRRGLLLDIDHFSVDTGECVLMAGEPGQGNTAMALVAAGRLAPFEGKATLVRDDGTTTNDKAELRKLAAVVDLPAVSEPDDAVPVGTVAAEGLALACRGSMPGEPTKWLRAHGWEQLRSVRMDAILGAVRTALLSALAAEHEDVRFLVLSLPDRHGGEPVDWWEIAQSYASSGYGVLVQCGRSSARDLGANLPAARGDSARLATPVEALRTRPEPVDPERSPSDETDDSDWLFGEREKDQ